ncbi:hypothetical protein KM043_012227 [Ampulex compressa]|nr:hypothetical protein KM043_012227 [Ampulex compressa]
MTVQKARALEEGRSGGRAGVIIPHRSTFASRQAAPTNTLATICPRRAGSWPLSNLSSITGLDVNRIRSGVDAFIDASSSPLRRTEISRLVTSDTLSRDKRCTPGLPVPLGVEYASLTLKGLSKERKSFSRLSKDCRGNTLGAQSSANTVRELPCARVARERIRKKSGRCNRSGALRGDGYRSRRKEVALHYGKSLSRGRNGRPQNKLT